MNPSAPYGHIPSISWGTDRESLIAEYGRLKRCLSSGTLAPPGIDVSSWRQAWMRDHHVRMRFTDERQTTASKQMGRLQARMQIVNTSIHNLEVALGKREREPGSGLDNPAPKYRDVPLLIPERRVEHSALGDREVSHDVQAPIPKEGTRARHWSDKQIMDMCRGRYRASSGYRLDAQQNSNFNECAATGIVYHDPYESEEEEDDPAYMEFLSSYTAKINQVNPSPENNSRERALSSLQRERYNLRRIMHAVELEIIHHSVRKSELSFQRTEQQRVTHYWCRMNQIRGQLSAMGDETDLDGDGGVLYDEKRARAATPPPQPEPCPW